MQNANMEHIGKIFKRAVGRMKRITDLLHFKDDEFWVGSMVGGQPYGLGLRLSEDIYGSVGCRREAFRQMGHSMSAL